jgi:hypothetical protein
MVIEEDSFVIYISAPSAHCIHDGGLELTFGFIVNRSSARSVLIRISRSPTIAGDEERGWLAGVIEGTTICGRRCGDWVVTLVAAEPAERRESPTRLLNGEFLSN